jgi:hypothetical protein
MCVSLLPNCLTRSVKGMWRTIVFFFGHTVYRFVTTFLFHVQYATVNAMSDGLY